MTFAENKVSDISPVKNLQDLQILDFSFNYVSDISPLQNLQNLQYLYYSTNLVSDISPLKNLHILQILDIDTNRVSDISPLENLQNLQYLYLNFNSISNISPLKKLQKLQELYFNKNPFYKKLPSSIQREHFSKIIKYWLDNFTQKDQFLREAKVVFVGEGEAGKTSLMNLILYKKKKNYQRTQRIEIHENTDKFTYKDETLKLYFWDFGGQEIMHATHKFFMTERSVYILVINGRQDDADTVDKWLEMLQSSCGNSPILLVVNKLDNENDSHQLPFRDLEMQYPQIQGLIETSWATGRGMAKLETKIQEILQTQMTELFEEPFAPKYFEVKNRLQALDKNYIYYQEYEEICLEIAENQETEFDKISQELLADRLNELGVMLNFRSKHETLEELLVFKPEWIIDGVYKIINAECVQKSGRIDDDEVHQLLRQENYRKAAERDFIIRMMKYFELTYSDGTNYLIPSTFKKEIPEGFEDYWKTKTDILHFRFQYKIWRDDYISFFLVNQHQKIKKYFWKNGAVLKYAENEVFIRANRYEKSIEIQVVRHPNQKITLWEVREALSRVHRKFEVEKLGISEWVVYEENGIRDLFKMERLQAMLQNGIKEDFSEKLGKMVSVEKLLGEVNLTEDEYLESQKKDQNLTPLELKIKKLNFIRLEKTKIASIDQKFECEQRIEELEREIWAMKREK